MGQYQQWLHYRETDQHLHEQLATLERVLSQLQEQVKVAERNSSSYANNTIIQALLTQHAEKLLAEVANKLDVSLPLAKPGGIANNAMEPSSIENEIETESQQRTVSAALYAWGSLSNLSKQDMQAPIVNATTQPPTSLDINHQADLLPEDISAFVEAHSLTDPQLKMPWWLRNAINNVQKANTTTQGSSPIDEQSLRTNRLVKRWFERWGPQVQNATEAKEDQEQ